MTARDFQLIATALSTTRPPSAYAGNDAHVQANVTAHAMVDALAAVNPRFDRARFLKACGAS